MTAILDGNYGAHVKPALEASAGGVHQVFVYGTLKNGQGNHHVLGKNRLLKGHARADGFVMVDLGAFPGAVRIENGGWHIFGEVYEVDDDHFEAIDRLEGHPRFYTREVVDLERYGKTWIYTLSRSQYLRDGCRFIPAGRWSNGCQAYIFNEDRLHGGPYHCQRPLVPALPGRLPPERPGVIVPEVVVKKKVKGPIVGPGWEEA